MGTPQYLSPEQAAGQPATPASDVYSLGVVAFECLAGRRPFEADSPVATALAHLREPVPDLPDEVPADLAAVVRRAMAKDPAERYADGAALARPLRPPTGRRRARPPWSTPTRRQVLAGSGRGCRCRGRCRSGRLRPPTGARPGRRLPGRRRGPASRPWAAARRLSCSLVVVGACRRQQR